jgi:4-hydroxyacetophenone monooxygenase
MLRKTDMGDYHYRPASGATDTESAAATRVETA